jgi:hypothetical protein
LFIVNSVARVTRNNVRIFWIINHLKAYKITKGI